MNKIKKNNVNIKYEKAQTVTIFEMYLEFKKKKMAIDVKMKIISKILHL